MEMPKPKGKSKAAPAPSDRQMRTATKTTRQGVAAGLVPDTRRSSEQVQQSRALDIKAKKKERAEERAALAGVSALEDEMRTTDILRTKTANHPVDPPPEKARRVPLPQEPPPVHRGKSYLYIPPFIDSSLAEDDNDDADDESDTYQPPVDGSEKDEEDDDSEEPEKPKKVPKPSRADVVASRSTQDVSGTPTTSIAAHKRKAEDAKKKTPAKKQKSGPAKKKAGLAKVVASGQSSDGPDDEEKAVKYGSLIHIAPTPQRPPTQKELRGNDKKWTRVHLPDGTYSQFTDEVVPLARELLGTQDHSWSALTIKQIQGILDRVYGKANGAWQGLLSYRLSDWRAGIATQGNQIHSALIDTYEPESDVDEDLDLGSPCKSSPNPGPSSPPASLTDTPPAPLAVVPPWPLADPPAHQPTPTRFQFDTADGIAEFVAWAVQKNEENRHDGVPLGNLGRWDRKEGTFYVVSHRVHLRISLVERALRLRATGELGDQRVRSPAGKIKTIRRATKFLATIQKKWGKDHWEKFREVASEWMESRKRAASSHASSDAGDLAEEDGDDKEMIILSD
ncbi:hypothetical protein C8J57DRAFT_1250573 [Mycena rebaudengoi]|nr:hypothetical protein C8J57DRAFT_1250573 [Mycena rebaudengoi]